MIKLPVIVGMGGMNAAGRTSGFHSYKRMVHDVLGNKQLESTWFDLANRMQLSCEHGLTPELLKCIQEGTLVRRIDHFDPEKVLYHHRVKVDSNMHCTAKKSKLSQELLSHFDIQPTEDHDLNLVLKNPLEMLLPDRLPLGVSSAGMIPHGFDLDKLYNAHHHPRGLKLTVYGMSDALNSLGFEWSTLLKHIRPDQISVYAGSALSQVDEYSLGGVVGQHLIGNRVNSKMMALSLAEMPADFINSYIINSVGATGHNVGACATFLYNLKLGVQDIQSGRSRVVVVGGAEAPVVPEIIEGFRVMGALATDEQLCQMDHRTTADHRRACRPFSTNAGFTLAEASQFFILMDDALAIEMGARIYGAVADVFAHADGNKKSIAGPGIGNYVTMAKAAALTKAILGEDGLQKTYVQAHGTGTPQNRTTESHILNEVAKTFAIKHWPVTAVKSYLGHSVAVAAGDQLATSLGVWAHGWLPGIKTVDHIAEDVYHSNLSILLDHVEVDAVQLGAAILNSKGFGGNNASAVILSPTEAFNLINQRLSREEKANYQHKLEKTDENARAFDESACSGHERIVYSFGENVMTQDDVKITPEFIQLSEFDVSIELPRVNPYKVS